MLTDRQTDTKKKPTELHKFRRNLAMMVIYLPVKFEFNWTKHFFMLKSRNGNVDQQTNRHKKKPDGITQISKKLSYDGDLSPCQV